MTDSKYGYRFIDARVPVPKGAEWLAPSSNAERVSIALDPPLLTNRTEQAELQYSFLRFLYAKEHVEFTKHAVRMQLKAREYADLESAAEYYNLLPATYATFQLVGADPRGIFPGMQFATAVRRYAEQSRLVAKAA